LNNRKRRDLIELEEATKVSVLILGGESFFPEHLDMECRDKDGNMISLPFMNERS
jgi:ribonuclease E